MRGAQIINALACAAIAGLGLSAALTDGGGVTADFSTDPQGTSPEAVELVGSLRVDGPSAVRLARFEASSGAPVDLWVALLDFQPRSITPASSWEAVASLPDGEPVLVSSVDSSLSGWGGVGGSMAMGCGIEESVVRERYGKRLLGVQPGRNEVIECPGGHGPYADVAGLVLAPVVTWTPAFGEDPCLGSATADACHAERVGKTLGNLGDRLTSQYERYLPDADGVHLVLPALGTGSGGMPQAMFYDTLHSWLVHACPDSRITL